MSVTKKLVSTYLETGEGADAIVANLLADATKMYLDGKGADEILGATGVVLKVGSTGWTFSAAEVMSRLNNLRPAETRLQSAAQGLPDAVRKFVVGHKVELRDRPAPATDTE